MSDLEKGRVQRDAKRAVASRRGGGSSVPEQAILRHLGLELYQEQHRAGHPEEKSSRTDDQPSDGTT
ncbi:hypothetical protein [Kribbella sp. NPDC004875]|uniref:hypothetical protein n=1 Tax=Kribbella sp. NPDC004875 TaxID=3364107 RepID=UPI003692807E